MKTATKTIWGIILIAAGLLFILNTAGVIPHFNLFFDGWWSLFIIIPSFVGLLNDKDKTGPIIGLAIGVLLMLAAQDRIYWEDFGKYALGIVIIAVGYSLIAGKTHVSNAQKESVKKISQDGKEVEDFSFNFGKYRNDFSGRKFEGADIKTSFGSFELNLRNAIFEDDTMILLDVNFGNVVILVPAGINVEISANSSFGEIKDARKSIISGGHPTLHIVGNVCFGGAEIH